MTIRVLEMESTVGSKVVRSDIHSVGRERPAISQEVNRWRRSSVVCVTIGDHIGRVGMDNVCILNTQ